MIIYDIYDYIWCIYIIFLAHMSNTAQFGLLMIKKESLFYFTIEKEYQNVPWFLDKYHNFIVIIKCFIF